MIVKRAEKPEGDVFLTLGLGYLGQFLGQQVNELVLAGGKAVGASPKCASATATWSNTWWRRIGLFRGPAANSPAVWASRNRRHRKRSRNWFVSESFR